MTSLIQICRRGIILVCFMFLLVVSVNAEMCDLEYSDFPNEDCSFQGVNTQMLKFGQVDNETINEVFFGSARYVLTLSSPGVTTVNIVDDDDCDVTNINSVPVGDLENKELAFIPRATNLREIEEIWVLDCDIVQDR